jgi:hypothetical protein
MYKEHHRVPRIVLNPVALVTMDLALQRPFLAEASTLLILVAGAILLYRSFREKYLVPWMSGWTVYGLARLFTSLSGSAGSQKLWTVPAYAAFVAAVGLFAWSVFLYVCQKRLLWPAAAVLSLALVAGLLRALWLPYSATVAGVSTLMPGICAYQPSRLWECWAAMRRAPPVAMRTTMGT